MADEQFDYIDEVIEQGTIVKKREGKDYTLLTIEADVSPVYSGGEKAWKRNYPHVAFWGKNREAVKDFKVRDVVRVHGYAQTRKGKLGDKEAYLLGITGLGIEEAPRRYMDQEKIGMGKLYEPELNEVRISGQIRDIRILNAHAVSVTIRTMVDNHPRTLEVVYRTNIEDFVAQIKPNNYVYMIGFIQTREPDPNNKNRRTEWIAAKEIIKAEERSA